MFLGYTLFSAAICRGLIEASLLNERSPTRVLRFPRLYAAASLKRPVRDRCIAVIQVFSAAICRGLIEASTSGRIRRRSPYRFPRLYAAAPLKRTVQMMGLLDHARSPMLARAGKRFQARLDPQVPGAILTRAGRSSQARSPPTTKGTEVAVGPGSGARTVSLPRPPVAVRGLACGRRRASFDAATDAGGPCPEPASTRGPAV